MNPTTVICRCCETTLEEILSAVQEGAISLDEVKRRTRAGMGLCQGKTCGPIVQRILKDEAVRPTSFTPASMRAPVRPVALGAVAGLAKTRELDDSCYDAGVSVPDRAQRVSLLRQNPVSHHSRRCQMMRSDVVVVGGGVTGCSIAYYLAAKGAEVVVVEKGDVASGTTSAGQGGVFSEHYSGLSEELGSDIEYREGFSLLLVPHRDDLAAAADYAAEDHPAGLFLPVERNLQLLEPTEAKALEPLIAPDLVGAVLRPRFADVNPMAVAFAYARGAKRLGVRFFTHTLVRRLWIKKGRVASISTERGKILCGAVVLAAGIWTPQLSDPLGISVPLIPRRGQLLVTEKGPTLHGLRLCEFGLYKELRDLGLKASSSKNEFVRHGIAWNIKQARDGNYLIGSTRDFAGFDKSTSHTVLGMLADRTLRFLPGLRHVKCIRAFAGWRQYTPDLLPILGRTSAIDGLHFAVGFEGGGIALAPVVGRMLADLIVSEQEGPLLNKCSVDRFQDQA